MGHYYILRMNNVPSRMEDNLTAFLFEGGACGVSEDLEFEQTLQQFDPAVVAKDRKTLLAYFMEPPSSELLDSLKDFKILPQDLGDEGAATWSLQQEEETDWLKEWKKGYTAFSMAPDFWIVPRWEEPPREAKITFHIEPGMAFGTGTHETTQLVVDILSRNKVAECFLDVGTGTGLLAFYALRKGFKKVVAIDNDPVAVEVAKENLAYNGAPDIEVSTQPLSSFRETFDVVVANIIQSVLLHLRADLVRAVRPGGELLLSGILKEHEEEFVLTFFEDDTMEIVERTEKGDWVAFRAVRSV
jgi:ribosomal protein L11 methyltransferase